MSGLAFLFCISFAGLPQKITTNWMTKNNSNVSFHNFGGQKYKSKVLAGSVPSGCPEGESGPWLSPGLWQLPATLGVL